jgi:hypothetical protein
MAVVTPQRQREGLDTALIDNASLFNMRPFTSKAIVNRFADSARNVYHRKSPATLLRQDCKVLGPWPTW